MVYAVVEIETGKAVYIGRDLEQAAEAYEDGTVVAQCPVSPDDALELAVQLAARYNPQIVSPSSQFTEKWQDPFYVPPNEAQPTMTPPGTPHRVKIYAQRFADEQPLFHEHDAKNTHNSGGTKRRVHNIDVDFDPTYEKEVYTPMQPGKSSQQYGV